MSITIPFSEQWVISHAQQGTDLTGGLSEISNVVFEVDQQKYVVYNLSDDHKAAQLYMMEETGRLGIAPKVFTSFPESNKALMEYIEESTITPKIAQGHCRKIGSALKKSHDIPLFPYPPMIDKDFKQQNHKRYEYIQKEAENYQTELSDSLKKSAEKAMEIFEDSMQSLTRLPPNRTVNLHTDLHPRNLFWTDKGFLIIDWENASPGHPYFDVASLSIFLGLDEMQEQDLLQGYFDRLPTPDELCEYALLKKIRWAYTSIVNIMWAYRVLEKQPNSDLTESPMQNFGDYMQDFAEKKDMPSLDFFVNVSHLALEQACRQDT